MSLVTSLGYVVVSASDLNAWREFGERLGLQENTDDVNQGPAETLYFRTDERSWRLAVDSGPDGGLVGLGFEVPSRAALDELGERLESAGYPVKVVPELAVQRNVLAVLTTQDQDGVPLEFFYGAKLAKEKFVSPRGVRFVTGDQGFGHAVVITADEAEALKFYGGVLGFRESDVIRIGEATAHFMSPNPRHHSLGFAAVPGLSGGALQHVMIEVDDLDDVGRALDRSVEAGVTLAMSLGRHTNDQMISFYCVSPSGFHLEYGWGGRRVDQQSHVMGYFDQGSVWGHRHSPATVR